MSAFVERLIAVRDRMKTLARYGEDAVWRPAKEAVDCLADAANTIQSMEEDNHYLRARVAKLEENDGDLLKCARYVKGAANAIEGTDRGLELARMIENRCGDLQHP